MKSILTPEPPLTPSVAALREDSAAHVPSPAAALSPIPKNAHLSLPFVPRCVQNKQLAKELRAASSPKGAGSRQQHAASSPRGASPRSLSMGQLRRQVREKTIDHRGRWPLASSSSTAASSMQEETEEVSTAAPPRQTPRPKLQLESVIVQQRKPCQPCAGTEPSIADDEDTASVQTHTLSGLPQGCVPGVDIAILQYCSFLTSCSAICAALGATLALRTPMRRMRCARATRTRRQRAQSSLSCAACPRRAARTLGSPTTSELLLSEGADTWRVS